MGLGNTNRDIDSMTDTLDMLKTQERELRKQIGAIEADLSDVRVAIQAIEARRNPARQSSRPTNKGRPSMKIDDAVIQAIRNEAGTPKEIHSFLDREMGIKTTRNSIGTRLGRLKKKHLVDHDGKRWIMPKKNEAPPADTEGAPQVTGEGDASPIERKGHGLF